LPSSEAPRPRFHAVCIPAVAVALGIAWALAVESANGDLGWHALVEGVVVGLTASGLYSGAVKPLGETARRS
jgi:hypothetical protein